MKISLRFAILKRDNFTCQYCRRTSWGDGVKLEVDHIIPRSKGGRDHPTNLATACHDCNRGKGTSLVANPTRVPTFKPGRTPGWHHIGDVLDGMWPEQAA